MKKKIMVALVFVCLGTVLLFLQSWFATNQIEEHIKAMTIEEKIGQMVIVGLDGYTLKDETRRMLEEYYVGGFVLFGENVQDSAQLLSLVNSLKEANTQDTPLFFSIDEEGGRVSRLPEEFCPMPVNGEVAEVNDGEFSFQIGNLLAERVKALGFNMNFAPVLDIDSNPDNPVIGDRSFGSTTQIVTRLGLKTMQGIQDRRVIPVVKHFPGHGDTAVDSHIGLPVLEHDMVRLQNMELTPFQVAIQEGADAVMLAHILLEKIDSDNPATMSRTIVTDLLREQMGFSGVVITDDLTMGAILENYDVGQAAVQAVNAGVDIILVCHGHQHRVAVLEALRRAVHDGTISMARLDESVARIIALKQEYGLTDQALPAPDIQSINSKTARILNQHQSD